MTKGAWTQARHAAALASVVAILSSSAVAGAEPVAPPPPDHYGAWGLDLTSQDHSVDPGDDFWLYANGHWAGVTPIPPDEIIVGSGFRIGADRIEARLRALLEAEAKTPDSALGGKLGGLYAAYMDEARREALDARPIRSALAQVAAVRTRDEFTRLMARESLALGASAFNLDIGPDPKKPDLDVAFVVQGGLDLPDRSYYLDADQKGLRDAYLAYIERLFEMIGYPDPNGSAKAVLAFETRIAQASWDETARRDLDKLNNPMTVAELQAYAPGLNWRDYLAAAGLGAQKRVIVRENTAVREIARIYSETPLETLKAWEAYRVADTADDYLSRRFVDLSFGFWRRFSGLEVQRPLWKRGVRTVSSNLGDTLGREYVARYLPPDGRTKMIAMVANLKTAMAARIRAASFMSEATKAEALGKLAKMRVTVGIGETLRDDSRLRVDRKDLYGDLVRISRADWTYRLGQAGKAVDPGRWDMTPQTVDAENAELENKIFFPAGVLQPPFFDPQADDAVNYGAIGAVIGHEITHGFDDEGRKIDADGAQRDWWTPEDARRFETEAARFGAQYDAYEPLPGAHINGKLTMGENIADLGGLLIALDAYHASLGGKPAPVIDGLTGDQRFFLAFAQVWRSKTRDEALLRGLKNDPHSPAHFRVIGATRNIDAWYTAFGVKPGTKYYLAPDQRVRIW